MMTVTDFLSCTAPLDDFESLSQLREVAPVHRYMLLAN